MRRWSPLSVALTVSSSSPWTLASRVPSRPGDARFHGPHQTDDKRLQGLEADVHAFLHIADASLNRLETIFQRVGADIDDAGLSVDQRTDIEHDEHKHRNQGAKNRGDRDAGGESLLPGAGMAFLPHGTRRSLGGMVLALEAGDKVMRRRLSGA